MAKQQTPAKTKPQQVPAKATAGSALRARMRSDAGKGVSTKAADNLVPLLQVLQPLSPQVLKKNPGYIAGAEAGDFIAKSLDPPVISGKDGFYFQPVGMYQEWVAWVPRERGGGFAGRYPYNGGTPPKGAKLKARKADGGRRPPAFAMGETDLVDTRYVPGFMWDDGTPTPFVIPFTSTGHAVAKGWMSRQMNLQDDEGNILPAFAALYQLTTTGAKNNLGEWFKIQIGSAIPLINEDDQPNDEAAEIVGDVTHAYDLAEKLSNSFANQEMQAEFVTREDDSDNGGGDAM